MTAPPGEPGAWNVRVAEILGVFRSWKRIIYRVRGAGILTERDKAEYEGAPFSAIEWKASRKAQASCSS
jgi:hypothetical protein